jgi:hypothetical protein
VTETPTIGFEVKIMGEFVTKTPTIGFEVKIMGEL